MRIFMTPATPSSTTRLISLTTIALALSLFPGIVSAQDTEAPPAGVFLGPVNLTPRVGWNGTYDDNVYRSSHDPISDIVSTFSADSDFRTQMRRIGLSGTASFEWVHFTNIVRERGANLGSSVKLDFMLNKIAPYATAAYENTQERVNPEIDTRPRSERSNLTLGSIFRFSDRSSLDLAITRSELKYDNSDFSEGVNLAVALNRVSDNYAAIFRQALTPLTHLTLGGEMQKEHFDTTAYRNGDEKRIWTGFQSDGFIKGHARAGVRMQTPYDPSIPEFRGLFVSAETSVTLADRFQIRATAGTDSEPSYRQGIAYYDVTSYGGSLGYALRPSIRIQAGAGMYSADYREGMAGTLPSAQQFGVERESRYDSTLSLGIGQAMSIDLSGAYTKRTADVSEHRFEGMTFKVGVSHAF
jgi:Uncharacterized protein conserved in bacteria (DUF2320).